MKPILFVLLASVAAAEPVPGDLFREFHYTFRFGQMDPGSKREGLEAMRARSEEEHFLELPSLKGVTKAEISLEYWGGHIGTSEQKFRINAGDWTYIPQPQNTPGKPECFQRTVLGRATVQVPVPSLKQGRNAFRFNAGPQLCHSFDWGFYWVYGFTVRLYYPATDARKLGRIVSPAEGDEFGDNPRLVAEASHPELPILSVDFVGKFEDFNWEGDGIFRQWHYITQRGQLSRHIGTVTAAPYAVAWDTTWIPDQLEPVEIAARIMDGDGYVYMTPSVSARLKRSGRSVGMYKARDVPDTFQVRVGRKKECKIDVDGELSRARSAKIVLSTWSAAHGDEISFNGTKLVDRVGLVHNYSFDSIPVPLKLVKRGENVFEVFSKTEHHALEVNWPGPVLMVEYGPEHPKPAAWSEPKFDSRIPIEVSAGGVDREDAVVEVKAPGQKGGMKLVEVDASGRASGSSVPFQLDGESVVSFVLKGRTGATESRRFVLYAGGPEQASQTGLKVDQVDFQGQASIRVKTPRATYTYHKEGAGFASIVDASGLEWIGYKPGGRAAGEFRGIPNLGEFGHPGYSGAKGAETRIIAQGPVKVSILSERRDGKWAVRWDIFPTHARMTMLRNAGPYWFLYEGTPGGRLDPAKGFQVTSDGLKRSLAQSWSGDLRGPEWIYFGDEDAKSVLFAVKHQDDDAPDQYWAMDGAMTVFGFGREYTCCRSFLTAAPAQFSIGFAANGSFDRVRRSIESAYRELSVIAGQVESRPN